MFSFACNSDHSQSRQPGKLTSKVTGHARSYTHSQLLQSVRNLSDRWREFSSPPQIKIQSFFSGGGGSKEESSSPSLPSFSSKDAKSLILIPRTLDNAIAAVEAPTPTRLRHQKEFLRGEGGRTNRVRRIVRRRQREGLILNNVEKQWRTAGTRKFYSPDLCVLYSLSVTFTRTRRETRED